MNNMRIFMANFALVLIWAVAGFIMVALMSLFVLNSLILLSIGSTIAILLVAISAGTSLAKRIRSHRRIFGTLLALIIGIYGQVCFYSFLENIYFSSSYDNIQMYFPPIGPGDGFALFPYIGIALIVTILLCLISVPRLIRQQQSDPTNTF